MSDDTETQDDVVADEKSAATKRSPKTSTPAPTKEPTQDRVEPAASAEPAVASTTPYATVSGAGVDPIVYSRAVPTNRYGSRKSLTVFHVQRRLYELGHTEAWSDITYGELTKRSVSAYQASRKEEETGVLTRAQFTDLFKGDPNVELRFDAPGDNPIS